LAGIADRESMDDRPIVDRPIDERKSLVVAAAAAAISISSITGAYDDAPAVVADRSTAVVAAINSNYDPDCCQHCC